jgi:hypothetical protein
VKGFTGDGMNPDLVPYDFLNGYSEPTTYSINISR